MKIKKKLLLGYIGIALFIVVIGYIAVKISQRTLQKSIGDASVLLVERTMSEIDRDVYSRIESIQYLSESPLLQESIKSSNKEFEAMPNRNAYIAKKEKEWASVSKETVTPFMQKLINSRLSEKLMQRIEFYERIYKLKVFSEMFITNRYGVIIAQTGRASDYYQADEQWWQKAKKAGLYVGDSEFDESVGTYAIPICIRINDNNKKFLGVVKCCLNFKDITNIIKKIETEVEYAEHNINKHKAYKTLEFKLLTKNGILLYSTAKFKMFQNIYNKTIARFHGSQNLAHKDYFIKSGNTPSGGEELVAHVHSVGYKDYKGLGWVLIVEQKTKEIFAPIVELKNIILYASLFLLMLALILGLYLAYSIASPITKLKNATTEIGKGKFSTEIEIKSKDEIGELATSFSHMVKDLKDSRDDLEKSKAEISKFADILENKVRERTKELENSQIATLNIMEDVQESYSALQKSNGEIKVLYKRLEEKNKELEKINQLKSDFVSTVSHELRTPLSIIKESISLIYDKVIGDINTQQENILATATKNIDRLARIICNLLDISKIEAGKIELHKEQIDIVEIAHQAASSFRLQIEAKGLKLKTNFPEKSIILSVDSDSLIQVFTNLLNNSIKFTKKGYIEIAVIEKEKNIECYVADSGIGISENDLPKAFNKFQQFGPFSESGEKGVGLGLSIARGIIETHKGRIWAESKLGKGTKFTFTLPK